jgi:hypothetical protein
MRLILGILVLGLPLMAVAQESTEDVVPGVPFQEGEVLSYEQLDKLKDYLPPEFWENREYFFYEGMEIEIGPFFRKYGAADAYVKASIENKGKARLGKDGSITGDVAGIPFWPDDIDCKGDPDAGLKIIWNFVKTWNGDGHQSTWSYTYWDRGEQLPLYYEGTSKGIGLKHRVEQQYLANDRNIFKNEKRGSAFGIEVEAPFDARGILLMTYRYESANGPLDEAKNDDTWVYLPDLRRVRRISTAQRTDSVQGTDFTMDDLRSFSGIPPQYGWECLGEAQIISPFNTKSLAYPYRDDYNFGPYGFSYANDRWELRDAWIIRFDPKNDDHPYHHKDISVPMGSRTRTTAGSCAMRGSSASTRRTMTTPTTTRTSTSTRRPSSRSTALRTTARRSSGSSSGTTTATRTTGTARRPRAPLRWRRTATGCRPGRACRSRRICASSATSS